MFHNKTIQIILGYFYFWVTIKSFQYFFLYCARVVYFPYSYKLDFFKKRCYWNDFAQVKEKNYSIIYWFLQFYKWEIYQVFSSAEKLNLACHMAIINKSLNWYLWPVFPSLFNLRYYLSKFNLQYNFFNHFSSAVTMFSSELCKFLKLLCR